MNICRAAILIALLSLGGACLSLRAQELQGLEVTGGAFVGYYTNGYAIVTNGAKVTGMGGVLTADRATVNVFTGDVQAEGNVRILRDNMVWTGEDVRYNFKTRYMQTAQFRTGKLPYFAAGESVSGFRSDSPTNTLFTARKAFVTADDVAEPALRVEASSSQDCSRPVFSGAQRRAVCRAGADLLFSDLHSASRWQGQSL
ncbi:MAG: hypothetical protein QM813_21955 [Verrucomicrobiota bacterium]